MIGYSMSLDCCSINKIIKTDLKPTFNSEVTYNELLLHFYVGYLVRMHALNALVRCIFPQCTDSLLIPSMHWFVAYSLNALIRCLFSSFGAYTASYSAMQVTPPVE